MVSFESPEYVGNVHGLGTLRVLEAVSHLVLSKKPKIYQASTSELFGGIIEKKTRKVFMMRISHSILDLLMECKNIWFLDNQKLLGSL